MARGQIGELAAEAEAQGADHAFHFRPGAGGRHRRRDIAGRLGEVEGLHVAEGLLEFRVGVAQLDPRFEPPE